MKFLLLSCFLILLACNRYEDGGNFSVRSFEKRLKGEYVFEKFYQNGQDHTSQFIGSPGFCGNLSISRQRHGYFSSYFGVSGCDTTGYSVHFPLSVDGFNGDCQWGNKRKSLIFMWGLLNYMSEYPTIQYQREWTINRLRGKELWINFTDENGVNCMIKYRKINNGN